MKIDVQFHFTKNKKLMSLGLHKVVVAANFSGFFSAKFCGSVAQSVEQWTENPCVAGSIPARATFLYMLKFPVRNWNEGIQFQLFLPPFIKLELFYFT